MYLVVCHKLIRDLNNSPVNSHMHFAVREVQFRHASNTMENTVKSQHPSGCVLHYLSCHRNTLTGRPLYTHRRPDPAALLSLPPRQPRISFRSLCTQSLSARSKLL